MVPLTRKVCRLHRMFRFLSISGLTICLATPLASAEENLRELLELRGYTRIGGQIEFSVYNKEEKRSRWLAVNQPEDGYTIESFDRDNNEVIIRFNGRRGRLPLEAARIGKYTPEATNGNQTPTAAPGRPTPPTPVAAPEISRTTPPIPTNLPPPRQNRSNFQTPSGNGAFAGGGFTSGRGGRPSPAEPSPSDPDPSDPGSGPGTPPNGDDGEPDFSWGGVGEPPPIPKTPPPAYNPST